MAIFVALIYANMTNINYKTRVDSVVDFLRKSNLQAIIIPSNDPHFGEYVQERYKCREWLSGFTGSAGTLVVTLAGSALWTDSRYYIQAHEQLEGSSIVTMRSGEPSTPSIAAWLKSLFNGEALVGYDSSLLSVEQFNTLKAELSPLTLVMLEEPYDAFWPNRSELISAPIRVVPTEICGEETLSKHKRVAEKVGLNGGRYYLLSSCDDIAWLCNIRGEDIPFNPLFYSYLLFNDTKVILFVSSNSLTDEVRVHLKQNNIEQFEYKLFESYLSTLSPSVEVLLPYAKSSYKTFLALHKFLPNRVTINDTIVGGAVGAIKAVKNSVEIDGFKKAMINDGVAWVRLLMEIEKRINDGSTPLFEHEIAQMIPSIRARHSSYLGESFSPIVAFGLNGALPHYSSSHTKPVQISKGSFLLIDSGAQYPFGTTDTTRTLFLGSPNREQILDYTAVLKGMIKLSMAIFPVGTRGASLDILARGEVYKRYKRYLHGTGHGVGHNLCVHEGPQSIRSEENPVTFVPGMVTSNEPAIYEEGKYGIRTENLILCKICDDNNGYLCFETLTIVPIDLTAVDTSLLDKDCIEWLNSYHKRVYTLLSPSLNDIEKEWLLVKCSNINN